MAEKLAELFRASQGEPVRWEGLDVRMLYERVGLTDGAKMVVVRKRVSAARPQALRLKARNGLLDVNDQLLEDVFLWTDTSPDRVEVGFRPDSSVSGMSFKAWNAWRDDLGVTQAWIGNAGLLLDEQPDGSVVLRCSDGYGEPTFSDLVLVLEIRGD